MDKALVPCYRADCQTIRHISYFESHILTGLIGVVDILAASIDFEISRLLFVVFAGSELEDNKNPGKTRGIDGCLIMIMFLCR